MPAGKRGAGSARVPAANGISVSAFAKADDNKKMEMLQDMDAKTQVDPNQNTDIIQKWLNATGAAANKPVVVDDLSTETNLRTDIGMVYHTDAPMGSTTDAKDFADQYMGGGRQYCSNGIAGGGTYFATDWDDSLGYGVGARSAYQFRGAFNSNAKIIDMRQLRALAATFRRKYPQASSYLDVNSYSSNYFSVIAAIHGYNVIQNYDYFTVLDRSATTVERKGYHGSSFRKGIVPWQN